jgi:voltage-gated potassium channel
VADPAPDRPRLLIFWDAFMVLAAAASVGLVFYYETATSDAVRHRLLVADWAFVALFLVDWIWDLQRAPDKGRFLRRNWWALFGMVPLAVSSLGFLRILRIVRVLRVLRAFRSIAEFLGSIQRALKGGHVAKLAIVSGSITLSGSLLVWLVERGTNPAMARYSDSLWWAMETVTTIGYGDVIPQTPLGRIIAACLMVTGIGTIGLLAGQVGSTLVGRRDEARMEETVAESATGTVAGQLSALAALHDSGKLSDGEFAQAKARVLR